jgi:ligand-binding sensor domain-containing protein/AraC-like DNA-binding protein
MRDKVADPTLLSLVLILCFFLTVELLPLDPAKSINQYVEEQWTTANGLPTSSVVAVAQTGDGYLWVATRERLCRFDGIKFKTYRPFSIGQAGYREITVLKTDPEGVLWIGTRGEGLLKFKKEVFEIYTQKDGLSSLSINYLYFDLKSNLWIGTDDGYLDCMKGKNVENYGKESGLPESFIYSVFEDSRGNLWVGTRGGGLYRYTGGKFIKVPIDDFDVYDVTAIQEDSSGQLWIGTNRGLLCYDGNKTEFIDKARGLSGYVIYEMLEDSDRNLWLGTGNGLFRIQTEPAGTFKIERAMEGRVVLSIFEDREKSIWIGTDGRGLTRLRDGKIRTFSMEVGLPHEYVVFLHEDRNRNLRVGTMDGLVRFDKGVLNKESVVTEFSDAVVGPICEDNEGNIWFGTYGSGLYQVKAGQKIRYTISSGLNSDSIISLHCDSRGVFRVGTSRGLSTFENGRFKTSADEAGLLKNEINCIYEDSRNTIWIGTDKGIVREIDGAFSTFQNDALPANLMVSYFYEDPENVLWIGTKGNGLIRLDKENQVVIFTVMSGLFSNIIYQVFDDGNGYFWMSSDKGVFKVIKKSLNDVAAGTLPRVDSVHYGKNEGMKSAECSRWGQHSSIRTADGKLLFGTTKGVSKIDPINITINKIPPTAKIDRVVVNNQAVKMNEEKFIFRSLDYIQFYFSASTLISPRRIMFKYRLENYEDRWVLVKASQIKMAHFRKLNPGTYTFRVMAANSDGIWDEKGTSFTFHFTPGVTRSPLFKIAVVLLILGLGALLFVGLKKYRRYRRLKNKYKDSALDPEIVERCMKKLLYVMDIEKLYKDDNLHLNTLAKKISITPHILSQIINEQMNKNFSDFVNGYRIEDAKKMLEEADDETSILHICYEVGFNSKSAFYRAFKKFTDMTPSQYQKELKEKGS